MTELNNVRDQFFLIKFFLFYPTLPLLILLLSTELLAQTNCEEVCLEKNICTFCTNKPGLSTPPINRSISIVDDQIFVGKNGNVFNIKMSGSCGGSWSSSNVSGTLNIGAISMCGSNSGIATASGTSDILIYNGNSWISSRIVGANIQDVACDNGIYYAVSTTNVYKMVGNTWTDILPNSLGQVSQIHVKDENHIWILNGSSLYYTDDGGTTPWTKLNCGSFAAPIEVTFASNGSTLISEARGLWLSKNEMNFYKISGVGNQVVRGMLLDENNILAVVGNDLQHIKISCPISSSNCSTISCNTTSCVIAPDIKYFDHSFENGMATIIGLDKSFCAFELDYDIQCNSCPTNLTTSSAPVVEVVNSTCPIGQMSPTGGTLSVPSESCPTGSTLQYSIDSGTNWSTILPEYGQTTSITVLARCNCEVDNTVSSVTSSVTTFPATCVKCPTNLSTITTPSIRVVNSTCPIGQMSPAGGTLTLPSESCPTGSTLQYSIDSGTNWSTVLPEYDQTTSITVLARCNCEIDNTISSVTSFVTTTPATCNNECDTQPLPNDCMGFATYCYCQSECNSVLDDGICTNFKIPLVFHYSGDFEEENKPSISQLENLLSTANAYFSASQTPIELVLFDNRNDSADEIKVYCDAPVGGNINNFNVPQSLQKYLNVFIVEEWQSAGVFGCTNNGCVGGHASFPWEVERGIRMTGPNVFGSKSDGSNIGRNGFNGFVLAHEVGHQLGLWHTFEDKYNNLTCNGEPFGDGISETDDDDNCTDLDVMTGKCSESTETGNLMDYDDDRFISTPVPTSDLLTSCQKAKMLDVLIYCKNNYCDTSIENYLEDPNQKNITICQGTTLPSIRMKEGCFTWYNATNPNSVFPLLDSKNKREYTPELPNNSGIYTFRIQDNGYGYNPECFVEVVIELKPIDSDYCTTEFTVTTEIDDPLIDDPCSCDDPLNIINTDGAVQAFHNVLTIKNASPFTSIVVSDNLNFFDNNGNNISGFIGNTDSIGNFIYDFYHPAFVASTANITIGDTTIPFTSSICDECLQQDSVDMDEDGYLSNIDCDDNNPDVNPAAVEVPNNEIDEDCNGEDLITATYVIENSIIKIYPNPTRDFIKIEIDQPFRVELLQINGTTVLDEQLKTSINIGHLPAGIYLLKVQLERKPHWIFEKIIISRP